MLPRTSLAHPSAMLHSCSLATPSNSLRPPARSLVRHNAGVSSARAIAAHHVSSGSIDRYDAITVASSSRSSFVGGHGLGCWPT